MADWLFVRADARHVSVYGVAYDHDLDPNARCEDCGAALTARALYLRHPSSTEEHCFGVDCGHHLLHLQRPRRGMQAEERALAALDFEAWQAIVARVPHAVRGGRLVVAVHGRVVGTLDRYVDADGVFYAKQHHNSQPWTLLHAAAAKLEGRRPTLVGNDAVAFDGHAVTAGSFLCPPLASWLLAHADEVNAILRMK